MKKLKFNDDNFDAAVILDGDLPEFSLLSELFKIKKIAADGAANRMIRANFYPDMIIGDMDSLGFVDEVKSKVKLLKISDQDTNDFEKILIYLRNNGIKNIIILGLHGGILEHTLNNISVLLKFVNYFDSIVIFDKDRYGLFVDKSISIDLKIDEVISIIPNPECNIKTDGLFWDLDNETLKIGSREGARNRCKNTLINITLNSGSYFLFIESRFPKVIKII